MQWSEPSMAFCHRMAHAFVEMATKNLQNLIWNSVWVLQSLKIFESNGLSIYVSNVWYPLKTDKLSLNF